MRKDNLLYNGFTLKDSDVMKSILEHYFIIDYGYVAKVYQNGRVDVTHAIRPKSIYGETLPPLVTHDVEMLTLSCSEISLEFKPKEGDRVILLGLKDYVKDTDSVTSPKESSVILHYQRNTMKAFPMASFDSEAKVKVSADDGKLEVKAEKDLSVEGRKIAINGSSKHFVTYEDLASVLARFVQALNLHTHGNGNNGSPTGTPITPLTLDISSSKTQNVTTE